METLINFAALFLFGSELIIFLFKRSKTSETKIRKDKFSALIFWVTIPASLFLGGRLAYLYPISQNPIILLWLGIAIILVGIFIRWTAILQLKKAFTVDVAISKDHKVKKDGLYRVVRHPSYLGLVMEFLGLSLLFNSWATLLLINLPIFLALIYRMRIEEELLSDTFGNEYQDYMTQTKRLFPGIY